MRRNGEDVAVGKVMPFAPGDLVHVRSVGTGTIREIRNGGRVLVEIKGRSIVTTEDQLSAAEKPRAAKTVTRRSTHEYETESVPAMSLDLHGLTVDEASERVAAFLNDALVRGASEVHVIHGKSGGRLKSALHALLKKIPNVRRFAVDEKNAGVTVIRL